MVDRSSQPADSNAARFSKVAPSRRGHPSLRARQQAEKNANFSAPWDDADSTEVPSKEVSSDLPSSASSSSQRLPQPPTEVPSVSRRSRSLQDRPRWSRLREKEAKEKEQLSQEQTQAIAEERASRKQEGAIAQRLARPNPLLGSSLSPTRQETALEVPPRRPPPLSVPTNASADNSAASASSANAGRESRSPARPNPLLGGSPQRKSSRPRKQVLDLTSADAGERLASNVRHADAETASAASSKRSKESGTGKERKRGTRGRSLPATAAPYGFEPAAFLESMFTSSSSAANSGSGSGTMLESLFSSATPAASEEQAPRRSARRSQAASEKPSRRTVRDGKPSPTRGSLRTSHRVNLTPRSSVARSEAATVSGTATSSTAVPAVPVSARTSASNIGTSGAVAIDAKKLAPWDMDTDTSPTSSPTKASSPNKVGSPKKSNKIDHKMVPSNSRSSGQKTSGQEQETNRPQPKRSAKAQANAASLDASSNPKPPTPSFTPSFTNASLEPTPSYDRTPSFEGDDDLMRTISADSKRSASFGENEPASDHSRAPTFGQPKTAARQRDSPAKDSSRRARIEMPTGFMASPQKDSGLTISKKVPLSSLAMRVPVIRLTRIGDVPLAERSILSTKIPAFTLLGQRLHEQRILGSSWQLDNLDCVALTLWYLPYIAMAAGYFSLILLAGGFTEALLISVPLLLLLPALHLTRLAWCDRCLQRAIDCGALAEFQDQLKAPLGFGTNGVFAATLGGALQAFQKPFPRLLERPPLHLPLRSAIFACAVLALLGLARVIRVAGASGWVEAEAGITLVAIVLSIFVGCSPTGVRDRVRETDVRLTALEAAFNTMLDTLRPLVGDLHGGLAPPPAPMSPTSSLALAACTRFSVRLITTDRNTLRADLHVSCKETLRLFVYCPLASFTIVAGSIDGAAPTELGVSAASPGAIGNGLAAASPGSGQGLSAVAATMGINLGERRQRRREDDEYSTSLASVSTASTLRRGGCNQPSEASLKLAMGMVTNLCARTNEPLEAFRPNAPGAVLSPKAAVDEPSILIALAASSLQTAPGSNLPSSDSDLAATSVGPLGRLDEVVADGCGRCLCLPPKAAPTGETFGVLRDSEDLEKLCRSTPSNVLAGTPSSRPPPTPLGRLSSDSDSEGSYSLSDDDQPRKPRPSPADGYLEQSRETNLETQHLAVVFDSSEDRDRCLEIFEGAGLLPEPSPTWP